MVITIHSHHVIDKYIHICYTTCGYIHTDIRTRHRYGNGYISHEKKKEKRNETVLRKSRGKFVLEIGPLLKEP